MDGFGGAPRRRGWRAWVDEWLAEHGWWDSRRTPTSAEASGRGPRTAGLRAPGGAVVPAAARAGDEEDSAPARTRAERRSSAAAAAAATPTSAAPSRTRRDHNDGFRGDAP